MSCLRSIVRQNGLFALITQIFVLFWKPQVCVVLPHFNKNMLLTMSNIKLKQQCWWLAEVTVTMEMLRPIIWTWNSYHQNQIFFLIILIQLGANWLVSRLTTLFSETDQRKWTGNSLRSLDYHDSVNYGVEVCVLNVHHDTNTFIQK